VIRSVDRIEAVSLTVQAAAGHARGEATLRYAQAVSALFFCRSYKISGSLEQRNRIESDWNSLAMPSRYVEAAKFGNEGVNLEEDA